MRAQALVRFIIDFFYFNLASCLFIALHYHRHTSNVVVLLTISDINLSTCWNEATLSVSPFSVFCFWHRWLWCTHFIDSVSLERNVCVCVCVFHWIFSNKTAHNQSFRILIEICPNSVHFVFGMHVNCIRILMCSASAISIWITWPMTNYDFHVYWLLQTLSLIHTPSFIQRDKKWRRLFFYLFILLFHREIFYVLHKCTYLICIETSPWSPR